VHPALSLARRQRRFASNNSPNIERARDSFRKLYGGLNGQALASAIFGGFLADRLFGRPRTVLLGAFTMAVDHFLMAFELAFLFAPCA
jgi:vacuolar-type H+-ATPase subunit I/STV1